MNQEKISHAVEAICSLGCTSVNTIIGALEQGLDIDEVDDFSSHELEVLLLELKSIMAVYEQPK